MHVWFQGRLSLVASVRWVELVSGFRRLASLYLNYSWVSDKLLLALSQSTQGKLKLLSVKVTLLSPWLPATVTIFYFLFQLTWFN